MQSVYSIVQFNIERKKINVQYVFFLFFKVGTAPANQIIYEDGFLLLLLFLVLYSFILKLMFLIHIVSA